MRNAIKTMVMITVMIVTVAMVSSVSGTTDGTGDGAVESVDVSWYDEDSSESTYILSTVGQLKGLAQLVNEGNTFLDVTVKLEFGTYDLDGEEWIPIGKGTRDGSGLKYESTPFEGTFIGNGSTIYGLTITQNQFNKDDAVGFFGIVSGGTVKNLNFTNVNINVSNSEMAGAVAGMVCNDGTISHCAVGTESDESIVKAVRGNGGIVGRMILTGTIEYCTNYATVDATGTGGNTGGIVGAAYYDNNGMSVTNCTNYGNVISNGTGVGGIVGLSTADVKGCENYGVVEGNGASIGGIVGEGRGGLIEGCTNYESAVITNGNYKTSDKEGGYGTGGIVGWIRYNDRSNYTKWPIVTVSGCVNEAAVTSDHIGVGGIVGMLYHGGIVTGCESSGNISGHNMVAGIVGGVQTTDSNHSDDSCRVVITGNEVSAGTLTVEENQPNIGILIGHLLSNVFESNGDACAIEYGSRATVLDNTHQDIYAEMPEIGGTWDCAVYIIIDGKTYCYQTLSSAIENAEDGSTIKLIKDTITEPLRIVKNIELNLDGCTLIIRDSGNIMAGGLYFVNVPGRIVGGTIIDERSKDNPTFDERYTIMTAMSGAELVIEGTTIQAYSPTEGYNDLVRIVNQSSITLSDVKLQELGSQSSSSSTLSGVTILGNGFETKASVLNIEGNTEIIVSGYGITGNGGGYNDNTVINIHGGYIESKRTTAILHTHVGVLNITRGAIVGPTAVEMRAGELNISGDARLVATDSELMKINMGSGPSLGGVAVGISQNGRNKAIDVNIDGGTFVGVYAFYEVDLIDDVNDDISVAITQGTFIGTEGSVSSENLTGFIKGGTYLKGTEDSNEPCIPLEEYVDADSGFDSDTGEVLENLTVTFDMPDGMEDKIVEILKGRTVDEVPVAQIGYTYLWFNGDSEWDPESPIESDITLKAVVILDSPVVSIQHDGEGNEITVSDDSITLTTSVSHGLSEVEFLYQWYVDGIMLVGEDESSIEVTSAGAYHVEIYATDGILNSSIVKSDPISITFRTSHEESENPPFNPGLDDDYVPIPPVIVQESTGGNDSVTVIACAAAAVVVALMAVFLVIEYRKN